MSETTTYKTTSCFPKVMMPNPFPQNPENIIPKPEPVLFTEGEKAGTNGNSITLILDESGSMKSCWDATISGFNEYISDQQSKTPKETHPSAYYSCLVSTVKFDGDKVITLFENQNFDNVPLLNKELYKPVGWTNLLDAIGETIKKTDKFLASKPQDERPTITLVIMTDGQENRSKTYTYESINQLVKDREEKGWTFMFLGANIDAFSVGRTIGMGLQNTMQYSTDSMEGTFRSASAATHRYRMAQSKGMSTQEVYMSASFTDEERTQAVSSSDKNSAKGVK